jgi:hypothetical protein
LCNPTVLSKVELTLGFWICLDHTADDRGEFALNTKKPLEEGSGGFDASSLVGGICLEVMAVL